MDKEKLTWRSFADAGEKDQRGPIATTWHLRGTPTLFVLDDKGIIRYKWLGSPGEKRIDEAIETLIRKAEREEK
jgi:peroxiredoxin